MRVPSTSNSHTSRMVQAFPNSRPRATRRAVRHASMLSSRIDSLLRRSTEVKTLMLRPSSPRSTLGVAAAALLIASNALGADRGGLRLVFPPLPVAATEDSKWRVPIMVFNDLDQGVFGDSLACEIHDLDPGLTGAGRLTRGTSAAISSVLKSLGE